MMPEQTMRQPDDPACQRRLGVIAEIEPGAPEPVLRLVDAKFERAEDKRRGAKGGKGDEAKQQRTVGTGPAAAARAVAARVIRCGAGRRHWLSSCNRRAERETLELYPGADENETDGHG